MLFGYDSSYLERECLLYPSMGNYHVGSVFSVEMNAKAAVFTDRDVNCESLSLTPFPDA
jgi:hypothetical protein